MRLKVFNSRSYVLSVFTWRQQRVLAEVSQSLSTQPARDTSLARLGKPIPQLTRLESRLFVDIRRLVREPEPTQQAQCVI